MTAPASLRLFISLELPSAALVRLGDIQRICRQRLPGAALRWAAPHGIHLTLRFLGQVEASRRVELEALLRDVASRGSGACPLSLAGYGVFPSGRSAPRVLYVGLKSDDGSLGRLAKTLDDRLEIAGWPPEGRLFHPHLTLARISPDLKPAQIEGLRRDIADLPGIEPLSFRGERLELMRSELGAGGSRYTRLGTAAL